MSDRPASRARRLLLRPRQAVRLAVGLWLVLGVVLWNVVFDRVIVSAGRDYLHRQAQAQQHKGPKVTIAEVMEPAAVHGVLVASLWSLLVTAVGLAAVRYAASRSITSSPPSS
jgi:hypothetical protein